MTLTLTACSSENNTHSSNTPTVAGSNTEYPSGDYIGMTVPQAQAKAKAEGVPFRITMADGEAFAVTMDYRIGRINAEVENGVVVSYTVEGQEAVVPDKETYNQDSWKTMIADSCTSYFDGCNNCTRAEGSTMAACTEKFCNAYQKPECLDAQAMNPDEVTAPSRGRKISYQCDGGNKFTVSFDEYVSGDSIMKLQADQLMFSDTQTRTATIMNRKVSASGEKYESAEGLVFWSKGTTAMVMQGEEDVYENCEQV
jgi:membrane-bound inhibitor of C-type lysozyme